MGWVDCLAIAARRQNGRLAAWLYPLCATCISRALATTHELLQYLVNGEARRLLTRRVFFECGQELGNDLLRWHHQENVVHHPIPVGVRGDFGPLVGVGAQVEKLRETEGNERLLPDAQGASRALLHEHEFPVVVAQSSQVPVVGEIKELLAWALRLLTSQIG